MVFFQCLLLLSFAACNTNALYHHPKDRRRTQSQWIPVLNIEQEGAGKGKGSNKMLWTQSPLGIPSIATFAPKPIPIPEIVSTPTVTSIHVNVRPMDDPDPFSNDVSASPTTLAPTTIPVQLQENGLPFSTASPTTTPLSSLDTERVNVASMTPTLSRFTRTERIENGRLVYWHSCPLPTAASPVATVVIEYIYTMTTIAPSSYHALQIPALEAALNEALARDVYLRTCTYTDTDAASPFYVRAISSAPYDYTTDNDNRACGDTDDGNCRFLQGGITLETFYVPRQRRLQTDQWVQQDVARILQSLLPTLTVMDITQLEFIGLVGAAGNALEPVVDMPQDTATKDTAAAAAVQQSPSAQAPVRLSWGAAIVALAAAALVLTVAGSMRKTVPQQQQQSWQNERQNERYTYEVDDGDDDDDFAGTIRPQDPLHVVDHDLLVDHSYQQEGSASGAVSTLSPASSSRTPILFLPVEQRNYQSPDTLDL